MRKIFAFLCALLLAVQFSAAQRILYVIDKDGKLVAYSATTVSFSDDVFSFTNGAVTEVTEESFSTSFQVKLKSNEIKSFAQTLEVGVCYSETNENITIQNNRRILGTSLGGYSFMLSSLFSGTTYYWRPYVKVGNAVCYGEISEGTTLGKKPEGSNKAINDHKFVDLGLPSGLLWAETNIGAETAADYGYYFAWGETTSKSNYSWSTYKYGTTTSNITKYNSTDGKTVLENTDDAAYVNWGSSWRMPTQAEFCELFNSNNCTWTWTSRKNSSGSYVTGYQVTSKKNGNSIFLPVSGGREGAGLYYDGNGYFWSSTLNTESDYDADQLLIARTTLTDIYKIHENYRSYGQSVRPVAEPSENQKGQAIQPTGNTQQKMCVVNSSGKANFMDVSSVDFATFYADGSWFSITDNIDRRTYTSISASCTVALAIGGKVKSLGVTPEVGVCYSDENSLPTINDDCQTLGSSLKSYSFTLSSLIAGTTYYYRVYIRLYGCVFYGDAVKVKTWNKDSKVINGHKFIDLGLPSGLLWAETNIGAETAADDGYYFAWGETTTKSDYDMWNYQYYHYFRYDGYKYKFTKYSSIDGKAVLENADDAAYVNWGSFCRMPTDTEFSELLNSDNCTWTWTTMENSSGSSINGYKVTSKKYGNSIFLPASGSITEDGPDFRGSSGYYWSSTQDRSDRNDDIYNKGYDLDFNSSGRGINIHHRNIGLPVRPVAAP